MLLGRSIANQPRVKRVSIVNGRGCYLIANCPFLKLYNNVLFVFPTLTLYLMYFVFSILLFLHFFPLGFSLNFFFFALISYFMSFSLTQSPVMLLRRYQGYVYIYIYIFFFYVHALLSFNYMSLCV